MAFSRRDFLSTAVVGAVSLGLEKNLEGEDQKKPNPNTADAASMPGKRPIIVSAGNGFNYLDDAFAFLKNGGDTLDAALKVVKGPEDDPNEDSVGLGGLPNEEGVVELDSCCMHGPTRRAGSVGGVRNIKNVSLVAKAVMEHTGHVMLVGEGAERFAVAQGFPRENLLTEHSRKIWLLWKDTHSTTGGGRAWPVLTGKRLPPCPTPRSCERRIERRSRWLPTSESNRSGAWRNPQSSVSSHRHHPLFGAERQGRDFRRYHHQRPGLEAARALRRFSDHRGRLLYRPGCGLRGSHGQRRRKHQGRGRPHHCGKYAPRNVASRGRHGCP